MKGCCCLWGGNGTFGSWKGVGPVCGGPNPISQEAASQCHQILKALNSIHHDKEPGVPLEPGLAFPSPLPSPMAAPAEGEAGSEYPSFPREAISLVCEAVPGAKGASRRRKVPGVDGVRDASGSCGGQGKGKYGTCGEKAERQECGGFWGLGTPIF